MQPHIIKRQIQQAVVPIPMADSYELLVIGSIILSDTMTKVQSLLLENLKNVQKSHSSPLFYSKIYSISPTCSSFFLPLVLYNGYRDYVR